MVDLRYMFLWSGLGVNLHSRPFMSAGGSVQFSGVLIIIIIIIIIIKVYFIAMAASGWITAIYWTHYAHISCSTVQWYVWGQGPQLGWDTVSRCCTWRILIPPCDLGIGHTQIIVCREWTTHSSLDTATYFESGLAHRGLQWRHRERPVVRPLGDSNTEPLAFKPNALPLSYVPRIADWLIDWLIVTIQLTLQLFVYSKFVICCTLGPMPHPLPSIGVTWLKLMQVESY